MIGSSRSVSIWTMAIIAVLFGLVTIIVGGQVLFGDSQYRQAAGNYVLYVVWFNFVAGFCYLIAGVGIFARQAWAVWLSLAIAVATCIVFGIFGLHIYNGGLYELRTVAAMSLRSVLWFLIFAFSYRQL